MSTRTVWRAVLSVFAAVVLLSGAAVSAQTVNQPPEITSAPVLTVSADTIYTYDLTADDADGDSLTWTLSVAPEDMIMTDNAIAWDPTLVGTYNVVAEVTDGNSGYDSQAWQISVTPGAVDTIVIQPNDRPTEVNKGSNKQFVATVYDQYRNLITTSDIAWQTDPAIGTIASDGLFSAERGGIGYVAASSDNVTASVGVVVIDVGGEIVQNADRTTNTAATTPDESDTTDTTADEDTTETTTTETNADDTTETEEETAAENTETAEKPLASEIEGEEAMSTTADTTEDTSVPCTNMAHWAIIFILFVYGIALILYFRYEKTNPTGAWWILPLLLTIIALIIYYQNICPGEYLWWPWTMVGIGVLVTVYYKGRGTSGDDMESQSKLPM